MSAPIGGPGRLGLRAVAGRIWAIVALPLVSILLALVVGAVIILVSEIIVPKQTFDLAKPLVAYQALAVGAFGSFDAVVDTLVQAAPLILGGLSVAIGFKAGLFNIGAQGQFLMGALGTVAAGVAVADAPPIVAIPIAVLAGILAGALTGFIPGILKALSGAHEVVTTIMLNYIAADVLAALVSGPLKVPNSPSPVTYDVGNAAFPIILGRDGHLGIVLAILAIFLIWWLLYRTTRGFEIRAVGANPDAARYAGMRPRIIVVATMTMCGALAGLAGGSVILGVTHQMTSSFGTTVGFDSIAVALLARSDPFGIFFAALLFGAMRSGAGLMQIEAGIPVELVDVLQATILLFLVASPVLRRVFRLRGVRTGLGSSDTIARTYGGEAVR
ncbi:MAG: ABC transporter permease [Candidatus Limnocylindrales bacterium]